MYKEYHPSPLLSPYIDKYWEFKGQPGYGMHINILPDGCTDFIFTLGEALKAVRQPRYAALPYLLHWSHDQIFRISDPYGNSPYAGNPFSALRNTSLHGPPFAGAHQLTVKRR